MSGEPSATIPVAVTEPTNDVTDENTFEIIDNKILDKLTVTDETNITNKIITTGHTPVDDVDTTSECTEDSTTEDSESVQLFETLNDKMHVFQNDFKTIVKAFKKSALNAEKASKVDRCYDNASLQQLVEYGSSSSDEDNSDSSDSDSDSSESSTDTSNKLASSSADTDFRSQENVEVSESSSSSSEGNNSDYESSSSESVKQVVNNKALTQKNKVEHMIEILAKGEMRLSDLPPIENLHISVPEVKCCKLGCVSSVIDILVVIEALPNMPPLDIDTVLFLDKGKETLGKIFDVFGPVNNPCYSVRFNSRDEITAKNIIVGTEVFCAPSTEHTNYVLVSDLMKVKGSDASWMEDIEPPAELLEFSDDEEEQRMRAKRKNKNRKEPLPRENTWEKRNNERNLFLNSQHSGNKPQNQSPKWWAGQKQPQRQFKQHPARQPDTTYKYPVPAFPSFMLPTMQAGPGNQQQPILVNNPFAYPGAAPSMPPGYVTLQQLVSMPPPPPPTFGSPSTTQHREPPPPGVSSSSSSKSSVPDV